MNSAIIKESSGKSVEEFNRPGLFRLLLKHEVKATSADYVWDGPKISPIEWAKMMAFFEWTQETEKSEAQVRWYVHPAEGWRCWAYPQKGGTGMSTKELADHPLHLEQRKQFSSSNGWEYAMTVHHHCTMGAFQSSTDQRDEETVDAIHITIGHMDKPVRDIHIRMYLRGHKFEPRMNFFWDIGPECEELALNCYKQFGYMPMAELDKLARVQMALCHDALRGGWSFEKDGPKFPDAWKESYIVDKPVVKQEYRNVNGTMYNDGKSWCYHCQTRTYHEPFQCPENPVNKNQQQTQPKNGGGKPGKTKGGGKKGGKADSFYLETTLKDIWGQLYVAGNTDEAIAEFLKETLEGSEAENRSVVFRELADAGIEIAEMEQFLKHLIDEKEKKQIEKEAKEEAQQQQGLITQRPSHPDTWDGYIGG